MSIIAKLKALWVYPEDGNCTDCMGSGCAASAPGTLLCHCITEGVPFPTFKQRLMHLLSSEKFLTVSPMITAAMLEGANAMQIWRMVTEHSALGQNAWSWVSVNVALWLWCNFYRAKFLLTALCMTLLSVVITSLVVLTVAYYRHDPCTALLGGLSFGFALNSFLRSLNWKSK